MREAGSFHRTRTSRLDTMIVEQPQQCGVSKEKLEGIAYGIEYLHQMTSLYISYDCTREIDIKVLRTSALPSIRKAGPHMKNLRFLYVSAGDIFSYGGITMDFLMMWKSR